MVLKAATERTRTYQHLANPDDKGYSLLELLVVVAILATVLALVPTVYSQTVPSLQVRQFVSETAATLRSVRQAAEETGVEAVARVDDENLLVIADQIYRPPSGTSITLQLDSRWPSAGEQILRFYSNGKSNGGVMQIQRGGLELNIVIDWFSGAVRVE